MTDATTRTSVAPPAYPAPEVVATADQVRAVVQHEVHALHTSSGGAPWTVALGYRRFREFDQGNYAGQDWCKIGVGGSRCVGVVTDGVSQSFMGDIAARSAGAEFWQHLMAHPQPFSVDEARLWFDKMAPGIHAEVQAYPIAPGLPDMVKNSLEGKRAQHGSQTVLAAFSLDLVTGCAQVLLLGDVRVVVHHQDGRMEAIASDARARWSSLKGLRGEPRVETLEGVAAIVLYSDGLDASFGNVYERAFDRATFAITADASAERDDVSLVAIARRADTPYATVDEGTTRIPSPQGFGVDAPQETTTVRPVLAHAMPVADQSQRSLGGGGVIATVVAAGPSVPEDVRTTTSPHYFGPVAAPPSRNPDRTLARSDRDVDVRDLRAPPPRSETTPHAPPQLPPWRDGPWFVPLVLFVVLLLAAFVSVIVLLIRSIPGRDDDSSGRGGAGLDATAVTNGPNPRSDSTVPHLPPLPTVPRTSNSPSDQPTTPLFEPPDIRNSQVHPRDGENGPSLLPPGSKPRNRSNPTRRDGADHGGGAPGASSLLPQLPIQIRTAAQDDPAERQLSPTTGASATPTTASPTPPPQPSGANEAHQPPPTANRPGADSPPTATIQPQRP